MQNFSTAATIYIKVDATGRTAYDVDNIIDVNNLNISKLFKKYCIDNNIDITDDTNIPIALGEYIRSINP